LALPLPILSPIKIIRGGHFCLPRFFI